MELQLLLVLFASLVFVGIAVVVGAAELPVNSSFQVSG